MHWNVGSKIDKTYRNGQNILAAPKCGKTHHNE